MARKHERRPPARGAAASESWLENEDGGDGSTRDIGATRPAKPQNSSLSSLQPDLRSVRSGVPTVRHGALCVVNEGGPLAWAPLRPEVARRIAAELVREAVRQEQEARP